MKKGIIIGAGIGGLTAGIALKQKGFDITIFERAPELGEVGAGIWVAPNGLKIFSKLGIKNKIIKAGKELDEIIVKDTQGNILSGIISEEIRQRHGYTTVALHRAVLHKILVGSFGQDKIITGKSFIQYKQNDKKITAMFQDGTEAEGDFLIAADGINSVSRNQFLPDVKIRYSGQTCWRFITDFHLPEKEKNKMYEIWGDAKGLRAAYSQINDSQVYCYITTFTQPGRQDNKPTLKKDLLALCSSFPDIVKEIILSSNPDKIIRNDLSDFLPQPRWTDNRMALLGDAAHATTPNLGQGACQAIEDGWYISEFLSHNENIESELLQFQNARIPKTKYITNTSYLIAKATNTTGITKKLVKMMMRITPRFIAKKQLDKIYSIND